MNENIKQLAIKANLIAGTPNGFDQTSLTLSQQLFAELIVSKCVEICNQSILHNEDMLPKFNKPSELYEKLVTRGAILQAEKLSDGITQYFGVNDE
jgi:hypothetical protein